ATVSYSSSFSFEVWVRCAASEQGYLIGKIRPNNDGTGFYPNGVNDTINLSNSNVNAAYESSAVVTDTDIWVHLAVSYNGGVAAYYRNGVAIGTATGYTFGSNHSSESLLLGARSGSTSAAVFFGGDMAEAAMYPTALSAARWAAHYAARTTP